MDMKKYLGLFISEAREHLEDAADAIGRLETSPDDADLLNLLFRHGHSIKGMAASMGFGPIATVSHALEDRFDEIRKGESRATPDFAEAALQAIEALSLAVDRIEAGGELPDGLEALADTLRSAGVEPAKDPAAGAAHVGTPTSASGSTAGTRVYNAEILIDPSSPMPAARAIVLYKKLESLGKILFVKPDRDEILAGRFEGRLLAQFSSSSRESHLREELDGLAEVQSLTLTPCMEVTTPAPPPSRSVTPASTTAQPGTPAPGMVRIPTDTLDRFLDHLGELIIHASRLENALWPGPQGDAAESLDALRKTLTRLRGDLMGLRMVPFEHIASRFVRSVRNLGGNLGKRVKLSIHGREVKLDRSMLEELVDPINHILRNAVDHGIETPEQRIAAGKEPAGKISIRNTEHSDSVTIEIEDDGRGMDPHRIREAALSRGFLTEEEARGMPEGDILMLVTTPGFSTAEKLTEISGRGVGMDVVRTRIESLGGRVRILSTHGKGTKIRLRLPFTVAVIHAFLIRAGGQVFAVPVSSIRRTFEATPERIQTLGNVPVIGLDGQTVQLVHLDRLMGFTEEAAALGRSTGDSRNHGNRGNHGAAPPALLFYRDERPMGLVVDAVLAKRDIVVKPLRSPLENLRGFTGATLLEDGSIAMILDVVNLAATAAGGARGKEERL